MSATATTLDAAGIAKSYAGRPVLSGISLAVSTGLVGVSGPNGSGKTTLLKILAGLVRPDEGAVRLSASDGQALSGDARRRAVGFAGPDLAFYDDFDAIENLRFLQRAGGWSGGGDAAARRLEKVGLGRTGSLPVGAFSTGMKQRLRLAFALLFEPAILLLDEPMTGLDGPGREMVDRLVADHRHIGGVVIASNDPRDLAGADRVVAIAETRSREGALR